MIVLSSFLLLFPHSSLSIRSVIASLNYRKICYYFHINNITITQQSHVINMLQSMYLNSYISWHLRLSDPELNWVSSGSVLEFTIFRNKFTRNGTRYVCTILYVHFAIPISKERKRFFYKFIIFSSVVVHFTIPFIVQKLKGSFYINMEGE